MVGAGSILIFLAAGCRQEEPSNTTLGVHNAITPTANSIEPVSCSAGLLTELDQKSFNSPSLDDPNRLPTEEQLAVLQGRVEDLVRSVSDGMCGRGQMRSGVFSRYRKLLVQNADGAENAIFFESERDRTVLVFQYVFDQGGKEVTYGVPPEEDVRDGLICLTDRQNNAELCAERMQS